MTTEMTVGEIKAAIESRLNGEASDFWHNTTEQNDFIVIAQRDGVDAAVAAVEETACSTGETNAKHAKYGYVITSTPGLIEEGNFPLTASGLQDGEVRGTDYDRPDDPIAAFATREEAESAMMNLVPEGSSPGAFAGLSVASAYDRCIDEIVRCDGIIGMNGFKIPSYI